MDDVNATVMWGDLCGKHLEVDRLGALQGSGISPCFLNVSLYVYAKLVIVIFLTCGVHMEDGDEVVHAVEEYQCVVVLDE